MHPVLFQIKSLTLYSYGFFIALAMAVCFFLVRRLAPGRGLDADAAGDLVFLMFVGGIIGARAWFVWQRWPEYQDNVWQAFNLRGGGLVWDGGFLAAVTLGLVYAYARKWPALKFCDFFSPIAALAHGLGRLGCFMNGCCYGKTSESFLAVRFPGEETARLPTQLFEALFLFVFSGFLFWLWSKGLRQGRVFAAYLFLYGAGRFALEFLRGDQSAFYFLTLPQWVSLLLMAAALFIFRITRRRSSSDAKF